MRLILTLIAFLFAGILNAQVSIYPYSQSFEEGFTQGHNVVFLPNWWGNYVVPDSMGQYNAFAHSGTSSLYILPEGEEFKVMAQVSLNLSNQFNTYAEFWVATRKTGAPEDQKRVKLNAAISINGGLTFPYVKGFGPHEGFPNADTDFEKFVFVFPPSTNNNPNVVLRFIGKSGGGPHKPAMLLLDDITVTQAASDIFHPYIMGDELSISVINSIKIPFSEPLLSATSLNAENYKFSWPVEEHDEEVVIGEGPLPQVSNTQLSSDGYSVTLTLDSPLSIGETYVLEMYQVTDLNGNVAESLLVDGIVYNIPAPGSLVFSEVFFADPSSTPATKKLQYVELYNPTTEVVPLGGLRIKGAIAAHDLPNIKLKPGEYWVATRNAESYHATFGKTAWEWRGSWIEYETEEDDTHDGESHEDGSEEEEPLSPQSLYIQTTNRHSGQLVDSIGFDLSDPAWKALNRPGYSIEMCNNLLDNLNPANWSLSHDSRVPYSYTAKGVEYKIYATPAEKCMTGAIPVVNLGRDGNYCEISQLTLDAGNNGSNYLWSTGAHTQTLSVTQSDYYSVLVNNGTGVGYDSISVSVIAGPCPPEFYCTQEQDFYGMNSEFNCTSTGIRSTSLQIMQTILPNGKQQYFGLLSTNRYFILKGSDIDNGYLFNMLPGAKTPAPLLYSGAATYSVSSSWGAVPLSTNKNSLGMIENNLLSQTITLYFNMKQNIHQPLKENYTLSDFELEPLITTAESSDCGTTLVVPVKKKSDKISQNLIDYLKHNYEDGSTVGNLFTLANRILGADPALVQFVKNGKVVYPYVSATEVSLAMEDINSLFKRCRIYLPEAKKTSVNNLAVISEDLLSVDAYPHPFVDQVTLGFTAPIDTWAVLQVFNSQGKIVATLFEGELKANEVQRATFAPIGNQSGFYMYKLTAGNNVKVGKLLSIKR